MRALILVYHRIAEVASDPWSLCVSPCRFAEHLEVLNREWLPLALGDLRLALERRSIPGRSVVITFDDGYADNLHAARPLLERFDIPATVFVVAGSARRETGFWWDELESLVLGPGRLPARLSLEIKGQTSSWGIREAGRSEDPSVERSREWRAWEAPPTPRHAAYYAIWQALRPLEEAERTAALAALRDQVPFSAAVVTPGIMRPDEVVSLARDSLIEIGAHTLTHPSLAALPLAAQRSEIEGGRNVLAELLDRPVTSFAYPFGAESTYTTETVALVKEAGFETACTTSPTGVDLNSDPLRLPRLQAEDWNGEEFSRRLQAWFEAGPEEHPPP